MKPTPNPSAMNREYFEGCNQGELRVRRCLKCEARFRFSHSLCPGCWSPDLGWEVSSGRGRVSHYSVVYQAPSPAFAGDVPYVIALIELNHGVRMMSNIVNCDPEAVHVGLEVDVVFEDREGIRLPMFEPAKS